MRLLPRDNIYMTRTQVQIDPVEVDADVESIEAELQRLHPLPRNEITDMMPDYVTHDPDVTTVGRLTAEAVAIDYEAAAKAIDTMGKQLTELQVRMEAETQAIHAAILEVNMVAEKYRDEGLKAFKRLEACAKKTQAVRDACEKMQRDLDDADDHRSGEEGKFS